MSNRLLLNRWSLLGLFLFGSASSLSLVADAEGNSVLPSGQEELMLIQQIDELSKQTRESLWTRLEKVFAAACLGGAFEGKFSLNALKEAYAQRNLLYFVRVLPAVIFMLRESFLSVEDFQMLRQLEYTKHEFERQWREQFSQMVASPDAASTWSASKNGKVAATTQAEACEEKDVER